MLKKLVLLSSLVVCTSIFAGSTTTSATETQPPVATSNKHPLVVKQGESFTIILPANQTTGFSWKADLSKYDQNLIRVVSHKYVAPNNTKLLGAPGYEAWTFQAITPQTPYAVNQVGHIKMVYAQPWSQSTQNNTIKTFIVVVSAKK